MISRLLSRSMTFTLTALVCTALPAHAQRPATWLVPDAVGQFNALTERADPLGFHIGESPDPSTCKHYQGLARIEGPDGTPYLIVTRSGNTPDVIPGPDDPICDDSPGETRRRQLPGGAHGVARYAPANGFAAIARRRAQVSTSRRQTRAIASPPGLASRAATASRTTAIPAGCRPPATCSRSPSSIATSRAFRRQSCCSST